MVRLCLAGGRLSTDYSASIPDTQLHEAAQLYAQGNYAAAATKYKDILAASPQQPDALLMLGMLAQRAHKSELALALFEQALIARPLFPQARYNRGVILRLLGRDTEAMIAAQMAVDADPNLAAGWDLMGQLYKDKGDHDEAAECYQRAIALQSDNPHFYGNYGALLLIRGDVNAAYQAAQQAERLDPHFPPMLLGNILVALGYPEQAAEKFARARVLSPTLQDSAVNEAMARLQIGDMEQGWALWEQRPDLLPQEQGMLKNIAFWNGQNIDHLIVYEDQGLGDAIQFLRYLPALAARAKRITLYVREPLRMLCQDCFPFVTVCNDNKDLAQDYTPASCARIRLSSLPFFFGTRLNTIPPSPYLAASVKKRVLWRDLLYSLPRPRIGLVWAGNKNFRHDARRSIAFSDFTPLVNHNNAHFVSLQKEKRGEAVTFFDASANCHDFSDTAAVIAELDLVISVDTATAHLAGALGKPVWILLPFISDWRWFLGREDSPWYQSARLFRQKQRDDWRSVIEKVNEEIHKFIAGDKTVLQPVIGQQHCWRQHPDARPLPL